MIEPFNPTLPPTGGGLGGVDRAPDPGRQRRHVLELRSLRRAEKCIFEKCIFEKCIFENSNPAELVRSSTIWTKTAYSDYGKKYNEI